MLANFDRVKEEALWFPILSRHGFTHLDLSADVIDKENAIDAVGQNLQGDQKLFALRTRTIGTYTDRALAQYKREFTIRYSRPSGVPVEWQKLFEMDMPVIPDLFAYGWCNRNNSAIDDYLILDVQVLKQLHSEGHLETYTSPEKLRTNRNTLKSKLAIIPVSDLTALSSGSNLIIYHSENHPALV